MAQQQLELLIKAKNLTDEAFKAVEAHLKDVEKGAQKTSGVFDKVGKDLAKSWGDVPGLLLKTAGGFLAFDAAKDAVLGLARAVGELASKAEAIQQKSLITGFGVETVQIFERIATNANVSSQAVGQAVARMQRAAVEGSKGFKDLGLSSKAFLEMAPESQFALVAQKIMALGTAAERSAAAQQLFGRAGAELIPVLAEVARGAEALTVTLSEDQVEALARLDASLDDLSGAWSDLKNQLLATSASSPEVVQGLEELAHVVSSLAQVVKDNGPAIISTLRAIAAIATLGASEATLVPLIKQLRELGAEQKKLEDSYRDVMEGLTGSGRAAAIAATQHDALQRVYQVVADKAIRNLAAQKLLESSNRNTGQAAKEAAREFDALAKAIVDAGAAAEKAELDALEKTLDRLGDEVARLSREAEESALAQMARDAAQDADEARHSYEAMADELADLEEDAKSFGDVFATGFGRALEDLPDVIVGAIQGGGDVFAAAGAHIGRVLGEEIGKEIAEGVGGTFGKVLGGLAGTLGTLAGSWIGKGISALGSALGIGGDKEVMKVNDLRDAFLEAHGGWLQLQKDLAALTDQDLVKKIFDADTVQEFEAATKEVLALLGVQSQAEQDLQAAVDKYGFSIEELGPKWKQQELDKQAASLLKDYELLVASGIDVNTVISKMGPNLNEYVQTAIRAGTAIPENMKPIIDAMIAQGQLLDENGEAYKSAEEAGITYTKTLTQGLQEAVEAIKDLVAALTGIPRNVTTTVTTVPGSQEPEDPGMPQMARGGVVLPFVPRAAQGVVAARPGGSPVVVGEGGEAELVAPVRALADRIGAAAAAAAGGGVTHVHLHLDGREIADVVVKRNRAGLAPMRMA